MTNSKKVLPLLLGALIVGSTHPMDGFKSKMNAGGDFFRDKLGTSPADFATGAAINTAYVAALNGCKIKDAIKNEEGVAAGKEILKSAASGIAGQAVGSWVKTSQANKLLKVVKLGCTNEACTGACQECRNTKDNVSRVVRWGTALIANYAIGYIKHALTNSNDSSVTTGATEDSDAPEGSDATEDQGTPEDSDN